MKTIILGDTHGRPNWLKAIDQETDIERVIFVGDYFDNVLFTADEQIANFLEIIDYKKNNPTVEVIMLIGNHDYHYFPEVGNTRTGGYQASEKIRIEAVVDAHRKHLQMAYQMENFLFSHAGVSAVFMDKTFGKNNWNETSLVDDLNKLFIENPLAFIFCGIDPTGNDIQQSPIWIRPESLIKANFETITSKFIQVFGHTKINDIKAVSKITNGRYHLIDCLGTIGKYMIIENNCIRYNTMF
jgi:predicted phosphodiesterase